MTKSQLRLYAITELAQEMKQRVPSDAVVLACEIIIRRTNDIKFRHTRSNDDA